MIGKVVGGTKLLLVEVRHASLADEIRVGSADRSAQSERVTDDLTEFE